jgi:hypothetical protein
MKLLVPVRAFDRAIIPDDEYVINPSIAVHAIISFFGGYNA